MKNFSSLMSNFWSGSQRQHRDSGPEIRKKKSYMIEIMSEVGHKLDSCSFELNTSTVNEINRLKSEFSDLSKKKNEVTDKLSKTQSHLKFLTLTSEQLRKGYADAENEMKGLTETFNKLEIKDRQLRDAESLDTEIDELKTKITSLNNEMAPSVEKQNKLKSEIGVLAESKTILNKELLSVSIKLGTLRKDVPAMVNKKAETEKRIESAIDVQKKYNELKEICDKVNCEIEELELEAQKSRPELDSFVETKTALNKELLSISVGLKALNRDVPVLVDKKEKTEGRIQLSKEIQQKYDEAKELHIALNSGIEELNAKLKNNRPELDSLIGTKSALNKELLPVSSGLNALRKDVPGLANKKHELENRIQLSREIQKKYDEGKVGNDKLNKENKELETKVVAGRQELKDSESKLFASQEMLKKLQGEKIEVDDKIGVLNTRKDKVDALNKELEPVVKEIEGLTNKLTGLEAELNQIRKDKEGLEKKKQDKVSLQQEFEQLKEKTKPIIDSLDNCTILKESSEKSKANYEQVAGRIALRREGIQTMEVRANGYKKAFKRLARETLKKG